MLSDQMVQVLATRRNPFPSWVNDYFDTNQSTFFELMSNQRLYRLAQQFLVEHIDSSFRVQAKPNTSKATKLLEKLAKEAQAAMSPDSATDEKKEETEEDDQNRCDLRLGLGLHAFTFEGEQLWALHQTIGHPVATWGGSVIFTSLVVFANGVGRKDFLQSLCDKWLKSTDEEQDSAFFQIYRWMPEEQYWDMVGRRIARSMDTVILPEDTKNRLVNDMERFLSDDSLRWYFQHGIPYKRSYLFYGVPGSGKSSLIQALAGKFQRNLCFLQPTHPRMTDDSFKACIQSAPQSSLIVLEDIDALFGKDRSKKHADCPLTFSGLLNGLDGVGNPDGQIFILSTNFVDQLDAALIRSGRVDLHVEFPLAIDEQILKMFQLFYPEHDDLCGQFLAGVREAFPNGVSMAALQQHFIQQMRQPPEVVLETLPALGERLDVVSAYDKRLEEEKKKAEEEKKEKEKEAAAAAAAAANGDAAAATTEENANNEEQKDDADGAENDNTEAPANAENGDANAADAAATE